MEKLYSYNIDLREIENYGSMQGFHFVVASDNPHEALMLILKHEAIQERFSRGWKLSNFSGPHGQVFQA